ncbi:MULTISPECIES: hypothetical protein [Pseudoalteromonas]|uniref:Uncharacterized protein n=1 Tax=Pseudoalteromonas luteoviolacea (strain 2ta16) TaxID=1353533 RepID=V4HPQ2_PSEL2|nr:MULTISPECIES: hypothetical protein [Pseudoalteromonas]ESP91773.1 hypothetical protein PL2TA16_05414 [Pseudoalteromonas luteoviolacea 2ta16]KZN40748.1 hypothetical protein N483_16600 [Pseudoalteromonas luteoviolacea NCIMB 1944]MCG7546628.1 hypothetical protein [Pseudoalteromonas sp. Of7M-16]
MKLSNLILLSIASLAFFYIQLWDQRLVTPIYVSLLTACIGYGIYIREINVIHIAGFILALTGIEIIIFESGIINYVTVTENALLQGSIIYGVQIFFTVTTALVLIFRVQLSRLLSNSKHIKLTNFDGVFHWLFIYMAIVNLLTLLENIAWSYFNMKSWTLIYDNFEGLIYIAWALCCGALLTMLICAPRLSPPHERKLS